MAAHKKDDLQMCVQHGRLVQRFIGVFYCLACMSGIVATIMNIINLILTPGGKMAARHSQREHEKNVCQLSNRGAVCVSECVCVCDGG